jgi:hypothetical protein
VIDEAARTSARADTDAAYDRADDRRGECASERDRQEQAEQKAADQDGDRWREDDLRGAARGRFFLPISFAAIAATTWWQTVTLAARRRAAAALHDRRGQTVATGGHPKVLLRFGEAASDLDLAGVRQGT